MKPTAFAYMPFVAALIALMAILVSPQTRAQDQGQTKQQAPAAKVPDDPGVAERVDARQVRENRIQDRQNSRSKKRAEKVEPLYPQATRKEPEATPSRGSVKALQKLQESFQAGGYPAVMAAADKITAEVDANAYDKSFAYQLAGSAAAQGNDQARAAGYFEKSLTANGLDNNNHYQVMFNLAATQYGLKQDAKALATLDRYMAETKSAKPEELNLRGALLTNLKRYDEAAAIYQDLMAKHPGDKKYLMNAVAAYQAAGKDKEAADLLSKAQTGGGLTDASQYQALYVTYINADKPDQAMKVIEDGLAKGVLKPGPELANAYMVIGQKAFYADDDATAIKMYKRAAPIAADGEAALNLAKLYAANGKVAEAKAAAKQALDKGVKDTTGAKKLAETGK